MVSLLLAALAVVGVAYMAMLIRTAHARQSLGIHWEAVALGAVTNFFDTLGIGCFAPSTAWIKFRRLVPDSFIPIVLNTGHALPAMAQALIFITLVRVDPTLLIGCIAASVTGALVGAPLVQRMNVKALQLFVSAALLIAAILFAAKNLGLLPPGGSAVSLPAGLMILAFGAHFVMGGLMTTGIGLYAPSLAVLSLMGINPTAVFPIMMGSCASLMPSAGFSFLKSDRVDFPVVIGIALGGVPAVLLAAYVVKSLPLETLRWGVVAVVLYAAAVMARSALKRDENQT
jgi:uncharacterized membrane protein YfcA